MACLGMGMNRSQRKHKAFCNQCGVNTWKEADELHGEGRWGGGHMVAKDHIRGDNWAQW